MAERKDISRVLDAASMSGRDPTPVSDVIEKMGPTVSVQDVEAALRHMAARYPEAEVELMTAADALLSLRSQMHEAILVAGLAGRPSKEGMRRIKHICTPFPVTVWRRPGPPAAQDVAR